MRGAWPGRCGADGDTLVTHGPERALTLPCIAISSSICYWFAEAIHMDEVFERKYPAQIRKLKNALQRYQLPIIIGWSFFLFLPTDLICYVCGSLRINFKRFLFGIVVGEGTVYAIYIFLGAWVLLPLAYVTALIGMSPP